jgi:hypothetical protein
MLQQEPKRRVHCLGVDQVVVVQDQQHLARLGGELVDQGRDQPLKRRRGGRAEQRGDLLGDPRARPVQRGDHMPPEPRRVVVAAVQRQPGHRPPAAAGPVGQQAGLAEPRRRAHQQQPPAPAPPPAVRSGVGGPRTPAAGRARAAWWPARRPARTREPRRGSWRAAQPSTTYTLSASSDGPSGYWVSSWEWLAGRSPRRGDRVRGHHHTRPPNAVRIRSPTKRLTLSSLAAGPAAPSCQGRPRKIPPGMCTFG